MIAFLNVLAGLDIEGPTVFREGKLQVFHRKVRDVGDLMGPRAQFCLAVVPQWQGYGIHFGPC